MVGKHSGRQRGSMFEEPRTPKRSARALLRETDRLIDWEPIGTAAAEHFSKRGRPSHDPVVMVKMMLVCYLFGVGSDRALSAEVGL